MIEVNLILCWFCYFWQLDCFPNETQKNNDETVLTASEDTKNTNFEIKNKVLSDESKPDQTQVENETTLIKLEKSTSTFYPTIGMAIGLSIYFASSAAIFLLITGSLFTRTILILLLIYQFCFAKKSERYRNFLLYMQGYNWFKSYTVYAEEELSKDNSIFSFHPHGVLGFGAAMSGAKNETLHEANFCGSRAMINLPISGIFARWMGVQPVNNTSFKEFLRKGKNIIFVPGGFEEATLTKYNCERIFIKERKGFIKYSLQYGYKIHPCYTFNENQIYYTFNYFERLRLFLNKLKMPGCIFYSKYIFFPNYNIDLCSVIGKAIQLPKVAEPTQDEIDFYHKVYVDSVVMLYNRYKKQFNSSEELEIL